jgi:osmotically-inducible protein OsmY
MCAVSNPSLQEAVRAALAADARIDAAAVAIIADDEGAVALYGTVGSPRQKIAAGQEARRVYGVRSVQNRLDVRPLLANHRVDAALRGAVLQALRSDSAVPASVDADVEDGYVILTGHAQTRAERAAAESVAGQVAGVHGVRSEIVLEPQPDARQIAQAIKAAFLHHAAIDADSIIVASDGGAVTLTGLVWSEAERDAAVQAAAAAPGVTQVSSRLELR